MRYLAVAVAIVMLLSTQARPEFFKWTDSSGSEHYTDDVSRIPAKYRKKATPMRGYDSEPPVAQGAKRTDKGMPEASTDGDSSAGKTSAAGHGASRAASTKDKPGRSLLGDGSRAATLAGMLLKEAMTEKDKAYAVFEWIRNYITYDNSTKWKRRYGSAGADQSPDAVLASGRGVCEGIANLFTAVAERMGLESVVVLGRASGARQERHAWNAVKIDGQWGLVDITRHTFLATPQEFLARHFPDDPKWQLLDQPLTYEEWLKR
jgi:transglutaminase/protease-like cytokinesis protein 3